MTDQERKDLAQAYQLMMQSAAWKHFSETLEFIARQAITAEDTIPVEELDKSIGKIGLCRGERQAIRLIRSHLSYILEGLK